MEYEIQTCETRIYDDEEHVSDCESIVTSNDDCYERLFGVEDLVRLYEDDVIHNAIHYKFLSCLGDLGKKTSVMAIHKKIWTNFRGGDLRRRCFEIYRQRLKNKYDNDKNMKYAWYTTSKEDITRIMSSGFDLEDVPIYNGLFSGGIYFSPFNFLKEGVKSCVPDDDGLMHIMLCRVLLESEGVVVDSDSRKSQLRSDNSNFGISDDDEIVSPIISYLVKGNEMSTHILPEYVISFKIPHFTGVSSSKAKQISKKPKSPWLPFSTLISELIKLLPPKHINLIKKQHRDFKENKISRHELIQNLKRLVGVELLLAVIVKQCETKGDQRDLTSLRRALRKNGFQVSMQ